MTDIKILGTGCPNCLKLEALVRETLKDLGLEADIEKVTDYEEILGWGIMATPGLVLNDSVVLSGRIPSRSQLAEIFADVQ
ncbi:MAG: thioredoxin family protein [Anaerolineales bacterium]|jgi:small redox-active disulfide protein 2